MNKTININLGGFFFHMDETAYQKLKRYLEAVSKSLNDDPQGKNEIIADIEARISELLSEKITDERQVVNENDIEDIISIMGQPEDYADTDEEYSQSSYSYSRNNTTSKKLFRDGEDKFLGGVAAGLAHYLNIDPIWIRLAFILFTVGGGFGFLIYIILWILLPEATTTAEKLQMEGEAVNIDNIEKKIREEFSNVSETVKNAANTASIKIKDGANEISEKVNNAFKGKSKKNNGLEDFINTLGKIFVALFKVIGKFVGVLLVFISGATILSLIIGGFSIGSLEILGVDDAFVHYPAFFYDSILPEWLLTLFLFILIGIPFIILFILGLRILSSNVKRLNKPTSLSLLGIWIIALLGIIFTAIEFNTGYEKAEFLSKKNNIALNEKDTLNIKMTNDDNIHFLYDFKRSTKKREVIINEEEKIYTNNIRINVEKSKSNESYFLVIKKSFDKSRNKALDNAKEIQYKFNTENNTISLDAYFLSNFKNKYKDEEIVILFFLAENISVYFDDSTETFLSRVDNVQSIYDRNMANHYFIMTEEELSCTDCKEDEESDENETENTTQL